jgi:hypothetical protein
LLSARTQNGTFVYGGSAQKGQTTQLQGQRRSHAGLRRWTAPAAAAATSTRSASRCELLGSHEEPSKACGRNDFHSDGELGGFFFCTPCSTRAKVVASCGRGQGAHWQRFSELLQQIPEVDGSFLDSHELGRSYGTAMALLTLRNCTRG